MSMIFEMVVASDAEIDQLLADPDDLTLIDEAPESKRFSLQKTWHGLHYLLTGTAWEGAPPLNFIVAGEEIGDTDFGYGPAKAFHSAEVKRLSLALQQLSADDLRKRFDPARMMALEIYPSIWDRDPKEDDTLEWLLSSFEEFKTFIHTTAEQGQGLVTAIQ
jgi:hypothetical protein